MSVTDSSLKFQLLNHDVHLFIAINNRTPLLIDQAFYLIIQVLIEKFTIVSPYFFTSIQV